jgi:hypothetical protein
LGLGGRPPNPLSPQAKKNTTFNYPYRKLCVKKKKIKKISKHFYLGKHFTKLPPNYGATQGFGIKKVAILGGINYTLL